MHDGAKWEWNAVEQLFFSNRGIFPAAFCDYSAPRKFATIFYAYRVMQLELIPAKYFTTHDIDIFPLIDV